MKKRLFVSMVLGVALAIVVAAFGQVWLVKNAFRTERDPRSLAGLLHPASGRLLSTVDGAIAAGEATPELLAAKLDGPVRLIPAPPATTPYLEVVAAEGRKMRVTRDADGVFIVWPDGAAEAYALGPFEGGPPWPIRDERLTIFLLLVLVVAVLFSLPVTLPIANGLDDLRVAARAFSAGDLDARARMKGPTREVAQAFNAMAERTQQLLGSQRHLLEAVSHELRTPTARIRFALEMLADAPSDAARKKRLASIDTDLTELDELVGELLTYTRVTGAGEARDPVRLDLPVELEALAADLRERRPQLTVGVDLPDDGGDATIMADRRLFRRAARNLLLNAARYAKSEVRLRLERAPDGRLLVSVSDDGPGIAPEDRARVFEPFVRTDESRARDSGGVGLGLAIVSRILHVHGGDVRVDADAELGGARFVMAWEPA